MNLTAAAGPSCRRPRRRSSDGKAEDRRRVPRRGARGAEGSARATTRDDQGRAAGGTETISYGIPAFKLHGSLVGFAAFKNHCSFFPMSSTVLEEHRDALAGYETSKGTIRFSADDPLPVALVKKLVKARTAENEAGHRP